MTVFYQIGNQLPEVDVSTVNREAEKNRWKLKKQSASR